MACLPFSMALLGLLLLASHAQAHVALWHPSMYGFCDGGNGDNSTCINTSHPVVPLMEIDFAPGTGGQGWWFHGAKSAPPAPGVFFDMPAGGTIMTELNCNKAFTTYQAGDEAYERENVCDSPISVHTADTWAGGPTDETKGCAIALAWQSDPDKLQPEDFVVVSTNKTCPFYARTMFDIPADLPPCPEGGCHALWTWIHGAGPLDGSSFQMYLTFFRARLTGTSATAPLPEPRLARKCKGASNLCVKGAKRPHFWGVNDRFNALNPHDDPPYLNQDYNFPSGAQNDLRYIPDLAAENAWKNNWEYLGCYADNGPSRMLSVKTSISAWLNTPEVCMAQCEDLGPYSFAAVAYGSECWCGNDLSLTGSGKLPDDGKYCSMPCQGNSSQVCGNGYISNVYAKKDAAVTLPAAAAAAPKASSSASLAQANVTGWTSLGCFADSDARILTGVFFDDNTQNSPSWCLEQCATKGFKLAALEYSSQCMCGNDTILSTSIPADKCNMPCSKDSTAACGGSYALNLYSNDALVEVPATGGTSISEGAPSFASSSIAEASASSNSSSLQTTLETSAAALAPSETNSSAAAAESSGASSNVQVSPTSPPDAGPSAVVASAASTAEDATSSLASDATSFSASDAATSTWSVPNVLNPSGTAPLKVVASAAVEPCVTPTSVHVLTPEQSSRRAAASAAHTPWTSSSVRLAVETPAAGARKPAAAKRAHALLQHKRMSIQRRVMHDHHQR